MRSFQIVTPAADKPFTIGRKSDNSLVLDNLMVSRFHAVLEFTQGRWVLRNLTSNSVTQLNGEDVPCSSENEGNKSGEPIQDGDVILIGPHQIRATLKDNILTLLLMESATEDSIASFDLTEKFQDIVLPQVNIPEGMKAACISQVANLSFKSKMVDAAGRTFKQVKLQDGKSIRLPGCEVGFSKGMLACRSLPQGYSVNVEHLDVFAGKKRLLRDINFQLPAGEILAIIGRSGQGKSSLLRLLQGMYACGNHSKVYIGGIDYRNEEIRKHVTFLEQEPQLRMELTVQETLLDGGRTSMNQRDFKTHAKIRLDQFCQLFGLEQRKDHAVRTLSGGELRRTALARELMGNPGLIILDEPLSGLDPYNARILCTHLKQLSFLGHTIILTTHTYEALQIANKVLVLHQGEDAFYGSPADAYHYFGTEDPEAILSGLTESSMSRWDATTDQKKMVDGLDSMISENNVYFPKTDLSPVFFYKVGLTAKQWIRDRGKTLTILLQPLIIGFLFSQIFSNLTSLWIVAFAVILSANWLALSLSIREIVSEKEILRNEFRKGVSVVSTTLAKLFLPTVVAWIQTLLVCLFVNYRVSATPSPMYLLCILAMVLPPVSVGLTVSSFAKNSGQANALLPLLIIPQVALAGALVPLDQMRPIGRGLSTIIWSRYNQNSLLNLLLERQDDLINVLAALAIAVGCYIVVVIKLKLSKKAK